MLYFVNEDYEIFTSVNSTNKSSDMVLKRKALHNKVIKLHEMIYPEIQKLGLSCHENSRNITTKIEPSRHTGTINSWLLVRYGKTPDEIAPYKEIDYGFTKHACIQFGIFDGKLFKIDLFLGRHDGFDRQRISKTITKNKEAIEQFITELSGYGMKWEITDCEPFEIDNNAPSDFCGWLLSNDNRGKESFLSLCYKYDDPILSEENIANEIIEKVRLLLPLYNALTQRKK